MRTFLVFFLAVFSAGSAAQPYRGLIDGATGEFVPNAATLFLLQSALNAGAVPVSDAFVNFTCATDDVQSCLAAIDTELGLVAGGGLVATDIAAGGTIVPATGNIDFSGSANEVVSVDGSGNLTPVPPQVIIGPFFIENPVATDDVASFWRNGLQQTITVTSIWCESDQTVSLDVNIDDGTPAAINGSNIACVSGGTLADTPAGQTSIATGNTLDLAINSVSGEPTWLVVQIVGTY